ncbi:MAG: hypothetical protein JXA74_09370 [Anaerolineae bacterium]|nr:hypothetical protein [Anaerolineae bacterium]
MSIPTPSPDEWRRLYAAAMAIKALAPWQWMEEWQVFGVQDPESDEIGFVSVMGALGEHLALAVYRGFQGLWLFQDYAENASPEEADKLYEIPHLSASFEDRSETTQRDRDIIKSLGLSFRGRQAWPLFRSIHRGYLPWYLEPQETHFLACALEQTVQVAPRVRANPEILEPAGPTTYLLRKAQSGAAGLTWEDQVVDAAAWEPEGISINISGPEMRAFRALPAGRGELEADFFTMPIIIGERGERPYAPRMLILVERGSGFIVGFEMLAPEPSLEAIWGKLPNLVLANCAKWGARPRRMYVRSPFLYGLLEPVAAQLGLPVEHQDNLRTLAGAKSSFLGMLERQGRFG